MSEWITVLLAGTATMLATGLGAIPVALMRDRVEFWRPVLIGVAAGAMAVASVVGLLKPGFELGGTFEVLAGFAVGCALFFVLRRALRRHQPDISGMRGAGISTAVLTFAVLFAHSLPEGFAVGTAYAAPDRDIGVFVIVAIALQNVPEGTSVAIPLQSAGASFARQFWVATATSLPQPFGAVIAFALVDQISSLLPVSFGFAAGAMLVLVVMELVPEGFVRGAITRASAGAALGAALIFALEAAVGA